MEFLLWYLVGVVGGLIIWTLGLNCCQFLKNLYLNKVIDKSLHIV